MVRAVIHVEELTREFTVRDKTVKNRNWFAKPPTKVLSAVSNLDLSISVGEKVAFIGPNGAGKSTTLKMLSGLLRPTSGKATVCDLVPWDDVRRLARQIGLVFGQKTHLWPMLSVGDSFDLLAKIYDLDEAAYRQQRDKLVEVFGLKTFIHQHARSLSLGQRMRSDIAAALLHQPSVLFLDEPTIGLDVTAKAMLRDHLNKLVQEFEITVLLTSHDTDDIEKICERVVLIDHGQKLLDTTLLNLQKEFTHTKILRLMTEEPNPDFAHPHVIVQETGEHRLVLSVDVTKAPIEQIVALCLDRFRLHDIGIEGMPLEEIIKIIYAKKVCPI